MSIRLQAWTAGVLLTSEEMKNNILYAQSLYVPVGLTQYDQLTIGTLVTNVQKNLNEVAGLLADSIKNLDLAQRVERGSKLALKINYGSAYTSDEIRKLTSQDLRKEAAGLKVRESEATVRKAEDDTSEAKAYNAGLEYIYEQQKAGMDMLREQLRLYQSTLFHQMQG